MCVMKLIIPSCICIQISCIWRDMDSTLNIMLFCKHEIGWIHGDSEERFRYYCGTLTPLDTLRLRIDIVNFTCGILPLATSCKYEITCLKISITLHFCGLKFCDLAWLLWFIYFLWIWRSKSHTISCCKENFVTTNFVISVKSKKIMKIFDHGNLGLYNKPNVRLKFSH